MELWPLVHGAVEDPEDPEVSENSEEAVDEGPVWLVRAVIVLFLVAFAAYLGREIQRIAQCWPC